MESNIGWATDGLGTLLSGYFPTLQGKTFFVLAVQLLITWFFAQLTLWRFRVFLRKGVPWLSATTNAKGQTDIKVKKGALNTVSRWLVLTYIGLFFLLMLWGQNQTLLIALIVFGAWSTIMGILVAIRLIEVDENLGGNVLGITVLIVLATALITRYYPMDLSVLSNYLFVALLFLIVVLILRLFINIPTWVQRLFSLFGVILFTGYLLFDFQRVAKLNESGPNTWQAAMHLAINIYLDIVNLFLHLLDFMHK